jgi:hypothetical protein
MPLRLDQFGKVHHANIRFDCRLAILAWQHLAAGVQNTVLLLGPRDALACACLRLDVDGRRSLCRLWGVSAEDTTNATLRRTMQNGAQFLKCTRRTNEYSNFVECEQPLDLGAASLHFPKGTTPPYRTAAALVM